MTLELADRSISEPIGIAEDVYVTISRALIDVYEGEITLRVGREAITFNLDQTSRYTADYNHMTANRIDVIDMTCEEYSQEVHGFNRCDLEYQSRTPYYDPIISTSSPTLTPFGDSDFLLFEEADSFLALEDDPTSPEVDPTYYDPEGDILLLEAIPQSEPLPPQVTRPYCKDLKDEKRQLYIEVSLKSQQASHRLETFRYQVNQPRLLLPTNPRRGDYNLRFSINDSPCMSVYRHSAIQGISRLSKMLRPGLMRWILLLQEFDVIIRDKKGAENLAADHLSRLENPHQDKLENKEITETFPSKLLDRVALVQIVSHVVADSKLPCEKLSRCQGMSS
ncbi:hypothetical protein Tco_1383767 [Tanacetum coccineum]